MSVTTPTQAALEPIRQGTLWARELELGGRAGAQQGRENREWLVARHGC